MPAQDESKKAEQELAKVRKLPENKRCANCLEPGAPLLTAVVMPFRIFVCCTCKSAHQSFSHRCKSTQMSLWTMEEVRSLEERNGGGNKVAQDTWLANARRDDRPREGDSLDRFKAFVQKAYNDKRWLGSSSDRRNDDDRDDRSSRDELRQRDREEDREDTRNRREIAPAPLAPPKTKAGASSSSTAPASRGQHSSRSRADNDDFNPNAIPKGIPAPATQAAGRADVFDPFAGGSGFIAAQAPAAVPGAFMGNGVSNCQLGTGTPGMSGGYAAAFGCQQAYQTGAQYQQMPGMRPSMSGSMCQGMSARGGGGMQPTSMPGQVPGGGVGGSGMQGSAFPQAFPQGYQQAFGISTPMQQGVQGFPQALHQQPQQPQPEPPKQAPRLEDLQQSLQQFYCK